MQKSNGWIKTAQLSALSALILSLSACGGGSSGSASSSASSGTTAPADSGASTPTAITQSTITLPSSVQVVTAK